MESGDDEPGTMINNMIREVENMAKEFGFTQTARDLRVAMRTLAKETEEHE